MTPFLKFVRNTIQKAFGTFYEGPDAPERLSKQVVAFLDANPRANRLDWAIFASQFAKECYRSGFQRGYEWVERGFDRRTTADVEAMKAHLEANDWDWDGAPDLLTYAEENFLEDVVL